MKSERRQDRFAKAVEFVEFIADNAVKEWGRNGEIICRYCLQNPCKSDCIVEEAKRFLKTEHKRGHPLFYELVEQMADLHARKNANYAGNDPLSNLKRCAVLNVPPLVGVLVRLQDKWSRIEQLVKGQPDLVGESLEDTLLDNAIYSLLAIIVMQDAREAGSPEVWINPLLNYAQEKQILGLRCIHCGVKPTLDGTYYHKDDCPTKNDELAQEQ